jgi:hypothetical protein
MGWPTMTRESADAKAARLLASGALRVTWVDDERVDATCQGTDTTWALGYRRGGWFCGCPAHAHGARCSHIDALQRVTVRPSRQPLTASRLLDEQREASRVRAGTTRRSA